MITTMKRSYTELFDTLSSGGFITCRFCGVPFEVRDVTLFDRDAGLIQYYCSTCYTSGIARIDIESIERNGKVSFEITEKDRTIGFDIIAGGRIANMKEAKKVEKTKDEKLKEIYDVNGDNIETLRKIYKEAALKANIQRLSLAKDEVKTKLVVPASMTGGKSDVMKVVVRGLTCYRCRAQLIPIEIESVDLVKMQITYKCSSCGNKGHRTIPKTFKDEMKVKEVSPEDKVPVKCAKCGKDIEKRYTFNGTCMFCGW